MLGSLPIALRAGGYDVGAHIFSAVSDRDQMIGGTLRIVMTLFVHLNAAVVAAIALHPLSLSPPALYALRLLSIRSFCHHAAFWSARTRTPGISMFPFAERTSRFAASVAAAMTTGSLA